MIVSEKDHYDYFMGKYSPSDPEFVGWGDRVRQNHRFYKISELWLLDRSSDRNTILDVGCGVGHILESGVNWPEDAEYTGIDSNEAMIENAIKMNPCYLHSFIHSDLMDYNVKNDYVIASGTFNLRKSNHEDYLDSHIKKMYSLCNKGMAFNLLLDKKGLDKIPMLYYIDTLKVVFKALSITDQVKIDQTYSNGEEVTVFLYKNN